MSKASSSQAHLRPGSECKEYPRSCSQEALIRSRSETEEKQANMGCLTEVIVVDSGGLRWEESGQHCRLVPPEGQRVRDLDLPTSVGS